MANSRKIGGRPTKVTDATETASGTAEMYDHAQSVETTQTEAVTHFHSYSPGQRENHSTPSNFGRRQPKRHQHNTVHVSMARHTLSLDADVKKLRSLSDISHVVFAHEAELELCAVQRSWGPSSDMITKEQLRIVTPKKPTIQELLFGVTFHLGQDAAREKKVYRHLRPEPRRPASHQRSAAKLRRSQGCCTPKHDETVCRWIRRRLMW